MWGNIIWQDFAIMTINIIFSLALIPQVIEGFKKKQGAITLWTSFPTTFGLFILTYTYFTLDLFLSTLVSFTTALLWSLLFIQRIIFREKKKEEKNGNNEQNESSI